MSREQWLAMSVEEREQAWRQALDQQNAPAKQAENKETRIWLARHGAQRRAA